MHIAERTIGVHAANSRKQQVRQFSCRLIHAGLWVLERAVNAGGGGGGGGGGGEGGVWGGGGPGETGGAAGGQKVVIWDVWSLVILKVPLYEHSTFCAKGQGSF